MRRILTVPFCLLCAGIGVALAPGAAVADEPACAGWDVEYSLAANLELKDTPMGEGDGVYKIGPGQTVLRFEDRGGKPGGAVKMLSYSMREHFRIVSKTLFWTTTVTTDTRTTTTPENGGVSEGALAERTLRWSKPLHDYRTDGSLTCDGSLCGKFGAPPSGTSELHIGPNQVDFSPFVFAADMKTFTMARTFVTKTDMPKQTAYLALAGREMKRTCVPAKPAK